MGECSAKVEITEMMGRYSLEGQRCGVLIFWAEMWGAHSRDNGWVQSGRAEMWGAHGRLRCGVHMERKEGDEKFAY